MRIAQLKDLRWPRWLMRRKLTAGFRSPAFDVSSAQQKEGDRLAALG
jgi:hypothetical protein